MHSRDFAGHPAGQIIGSMDKVRSAKDMVRDMIEGWIETTEKLSGLLTD